MTQEKTPEVQTNETPKEKVPVSPIEEAKDVLQKITEQNQIMAGNLERVERLQSEQMLSGKAAAGTATKEKTQDEKDTEGARKMIEGTGYEDQLFPKK